MVVIIPASACRRSWLDASGQSCRRVVVRWQQRLLLVSVRHDGPERGEQPGLICQEAAEPIPYQLLDLGGRQAHARGILSKMLWRGDVAVGWCGAAILR